MRFGLIILAVFVMIFTLEEMVAGQCPSEQYSVNGACVDCGCDQQTAHNLTCDQQTGQCPCKYDYIKRTCNDVKERTFKFDITKNAESSEKYNHITIWCHGNCVIRGLKSKYAGGGYLSLWGSTKKWSINNFGTTYKNGFMFCKGKTYATEVTCGEDSGKSKKKGDLPPYTGTLGTSEAHIIFFTNRNVYGVELKSKIANFKKIEVTAAKYEPNRRS